MGRVEPVAMFKSTPLDLIQFKLSQELHALEQTAKIKSNEKATILFIPVSFPKLQLFRIKTKR